MEDEFSEFSRDAIGKRVGEERKSFPRVLREVVAMSDIVLEVLDARFIDETRNYEVEEYIHARGKQIIYVLNKADLVDVEKIKKTLKLYPFVFISSTRREGSVRLRNMIKRFAREVDLSALKMKKVSIGVIGYPNTGKSSLLNFLTGKTSAGVGNQAGYTKGLQKVNLTKEIVIIDSPGVIESEDYSMTNAKKISGHAKVGARSYSNVKNPDFAVQGLLDDDEILRRLEKFYGVSSEGNSDVLLENLGQKLSIFKRGGVVDEDKVARLVLKDWQEGKL